MPDFEAYEEIPVDDRNFSSIRQTSQADLQTQARSLSTTPQSGLLTTLVGDAALGVVDLVDVVASSIPGTSLLGAERGKVNNAFLSLIDQPRLTEFYNQNKGGIEVASGIYGLVATTFLDRGLSKVAAPFVAGLKSTPFIKNILTLDTQYAQAMQATRAVDLQLAKSGATGASVWKTPMDIRTGVVGAFGPEVGVASTLTRSQAVNTAFGKAFGKGVVDTAKFEAIAATTLNSNEFLYTQDLATDLAWGALGLGGGGLFQALGAGYQFRKFANSDYLNRVKAAATDPTGQEAARLEILKYNPGDKAKTFLGSLGGIWSDEVTSLLVSAQAKPAAGVSPEVMSRLAAQHNKRAVETITKVTSKGLPGIGGGFDTTSPGLGNHIMSLMRHDAGFAYGAELMAAIPDGYTAKQITDHFATLTTDRVTELQTRLVEHRKGTKIMKDTEKAATLTELKQLKFTQELTPGVLIDEEFMPASFAEVYDNFAEPRFQITTPTKGTELVEAYDGQGKPLGVGIETTGQIYLPNVKGKLGTIDNASHTNVLNLYRVADKVLKRLETLSSNPNFAFAIPSEMVNGKRVYSWLHLDMAEELLRRTNGNANINWGTLTREEAQKQSLLQKVEAIRALNLNTVDPVAMQKLRLRYNLPRLTSYEMGVLGTTNGPIDSFIRGSTSTSQQALEAMSITDLKQAFADVSNIGDFTQTAVKDVDSFMGKSFNFMRDSDGNPTKPILAYKRNIAPTDFIPDRLAERIAIKKTAQAKMLVGPEAGPITREIVAGSLVNPDYELASRVAGLQDTQIASSIPGLANNPSQTAFGALRNAVVTAEHRARDNPAILAVTRFRKGIVNQIQGIMRRDIEGAFGQALAELNGPANASSRALIDNFHSFRSGWDLEGKLIQVPGPNGKQLNAFVLADTVANKNRWRQQFGTTMGKGQTLVDSKGVEVVLDDRALDIQNRFNMVTDKIRIEKNTLLAARGLPQIRRVEYYVPPTNVQGKYIGFLFDSANNLVPGSTIVAKTQQAFDRELAAAKANPKSGHNTVPGAVFRLRDDVQNFADIWDKAQMEMLNPGTTPIQGNKQSGGKLTGTFTNVNIFDESMADLRSQYQNHADDLISTLLREPIDAAKSRSNIAGGIKRNADSTETQYRSIYDYWIEAATGKSPLSSSGSIVGKIQNTIENSVDDFLRESAPTAAHTWRVATDYLNTVNPWSKDKRSADTFQKLSKELGKYMPFESVAEFIERSDLATQPASLKELTGKANQFTATWMLRVLEPATALVNMAGVVNALPAVIRHISAKEGETSADVAARIGQSANIFTSPDGRTFSSLDMGKVMLNGFKEAWTGAADTYLEEAAKRGMIGQEVLEFQKAFNSVTNRSSFDKFMNGDPTDPSLFKQKGLVGWLSVLTDKSEEFSRLWAHMAGREVGKMSGITDQQGLLNFSHDFADKIIANYSAGNRPEVFQGALGSTIGLFQSFMVSYWQRMFRYVETGDTAALATQYATQASLFGVKTVPGFNELNSLAFHGSEGEESPYDSLFRRFGQAGGDFLMAGTLSNLPKLFGAPGLALYTRGDVSPRLDLTNPIANSAAVSVFSKVMGGIAEGVALFADSNPDLNSQQVGEVLSNMIPNRPIAGFVELALAGGYDTDGLGQVINQTKTFMEATYRVIGLRTLDQAKNVEAFYSNKEAQEIQGAKREQFNQLIRGSIRGGDPDAIPKYIESYLESGGDPRQVKRMIRSAYDAALETRSERQLNAVIKNPNKMAQVNRLMDANVGIYDDAVTENPENVYGVADPMDEENPTATDDSNSLAYPQ